MDIFATYGKCIVYLPFGLLFLTIIKPMSLIDPWYENYLQY